MSFKYVTMRWMWINKIQIANCKPLKSLQYNSRDYRLLQATRQVSFFLTLEIINWSISFVKRFLLNSCCVTQILQNHYPLCCTLNTPATIMKQTIWNSVHLFLTNLHPDFINFLNLTKGSVAADEGSLAIMNGEGNHRLLLYHPVLGYPLLHSMVWIFFCLNCLFI